MTTMTSDVPTQIHDPDVPHGEPDAASRGLVTAGAAPGGQAEARAGRAMTVAGIIVLAVFLLELVLLAAGLLTLADPAVFLEPIVAP
jgi:hypothetical protein